MADLCLDASAYFIGSRATVLIGVPPITKDSQSLPDVAVTTAAAVPFGATFMTVVSLTRAVQRGDRLRYGAAVVQIDDPAAAGATNINLKPTLRAIIAGADAFTQEYVPYLSVASIDWQMNGEKVEIRNIGACDWASSLKTKITGSLTLDGSLVDRGVDPGSSLIRAAAGSTLNRVHVKVIEPDGSMIRGNFWVEQFSRKIAVDTAVTQAITLTLDGAAIYSEATDLVLA